MFREFWDLIYPRKCAVCGEYLETEDEFLCSSCKKELPLTYFWSWRDNPAEQMLWGRTYLQGVISLYFYSKDNDFHQLIYKIKYEGQTSLGKYLGQQLGEYISRSGYPLPDYIVPVPVHWKRKWQRGYNQAEVISRGVQKGLASAETDTDNASGKPIPILRRLLHRRHHSTSQTNMTMGAKWENVHDAFSLCKCFPAETLYGKHIFLVDDVLTSGATAEACYDVLRSIEGIRITLVTLAYVKK